MYIALLGNPTPSAVTPEKLAVKQKKSKVVVAVVVVVVVVVVR